MTAWLCQHLISLCQELEPISHLLSLQVVLASSLSTSKSPNVLLNFLQDLFPFRVAGSTYWSLQHPLEGAPWCPKTGLFSSPLSTLSWKDPCTLQVEVLVVPHPPSQWNHVNFFPGISTGLLAINLDPDVKSRALDALLLASTHLSRLCLFSWAL